jgi:hypothetical protein
MISRWFDADSGHVWERMIIGVNISGMIMIMFDFSHPKSCNLLVLARSPIGLSLDDLLPSRSPPLNRYRPFRAFLIWFPCNPT